MAVTPFDIFISYRHADAERVTAFVHVLEALGLRVWFDTHRIDDFASITGAIRDGLAQAKVLLAWYSKSYPQSRACLWELTSAFVAAQQAGKVIDRILIFNPEASNVHIHPVELRDALFIGKEEIDASARDWGTLAGKVADRVREVDAVLGSITSLAPPPWYGLKPLGSAEFVGRLVDFWNLHSELNTADYPIITGEIRPTVVQLQGQGGVGKSLLAEEYALRFGAAYPGGVFWLRAYGNEAAQDSLGGAQLEAARAEEIASFARQLDIVVEGRKIDEVEGALGRCLRDRGKPFLWIVDDLPPALTTGEFRRWLAPASLGKTLITTRSRSYPATALNLEVLDRQSGRALLTLWRKPCDDAEAAAADALAENLGYHPLALWVTAASLRDYPSASPFTEYLALLVDPREDFLEIAAELAGALPSEHVASIVATLGRSIQRLDLAAMDFLRLASAMAAAPILGSFVADVFAELEETDASASAKVKGRLRAQAAFRQVRDQCLADADQGAEPQYRVHGLVSRMVRRYDGDTRRRTWFVVEAANQLRTRLRGAWDREKHAQLDMHVVHARYILAAAEDPFVDQLAWPLAEFDFQRGYFAASVSLFQRAAAFSEKLSGADDASTLYRIERLAEALGFAGDLQESATQYERLLSRRSELLGSDHDDTVRTMESFAAMLRVIDRFDRSRALLEAAVVLRTGKYGAAGKETLRAKHNLMNTLLLDDKVPEARRVCQELIDAIHRHGLGDEDLAEEKLKTDLAEIERREGKLDAAALLLDDALRAAAKRIGWHNLDTVKIASRLAIVLTERGDTHRSRALLKWILKKSRAVLGPDHMDTLDILGHLVAAWVREGRYDKARVLGDELLQRSRRSLGDYHPDTLLRMKTHAATLRALGEFADARKLLELTIEKYDKLFGAQNAETLDAKCALAQTLAESGCLEEGVSLMSDVLSVWRAGHDRDNVSTSRYAADLAGFLVRAGKESEAWVVIDEQLAWLAAADPSTLAPLQREIRKRVAAALEARQNQASPPARP